VRHLSADDEVTLLSYYDLGDEALIPRLRDFCRDVRVVPLSPDRSITRRLRQIRSVASPTSHRERELYSAPMQAAIDSLLAEESFDIIQIESNRMACFRLRTNARVVINEHNIESELVGRMGQGERSALRRAHHRLEERKLRRFERTLWGRVDGVALTSEREEEMVQRLVPGTPTAVVPNCVDLEYFSPASGEVEDGQIVFTGLLNYRPNYDAARYLVDDLLPRIRERHRDVTLTIVGNGKEADLDSLRRPGVTVTGWVQDVRPYVRRASVVVVPLRIGAGTRLKVVEGLAMAKPMVSTTIGCEGIDVHPGEHLLVADAPDDFADAVALLLRDRELGSRLGAAGHRLARDHYSWEGAVGELSRLYDRLDVAPATRGGRSN
jgi:glycosyltransferase involved in cell wall biosynthesis